MKGGPATGPSPADRGKTGSKHHIIVEAHGIPPATTLTSVHRWVVEGALALLHWVRRPRIRWEIHDDIHDAFLTLGCAIICWRRLRNALRQES